MFHFIYGMSSFPLTNSYFSRCLKHVETTNQMMFGKTNGKPWNMMGKTMGYHPHLSELMWIICRKYIQPLGMFFRALVCGRTNGLTNHPSR
jgi:hypothetical protein